MSTIAPREAKGMNSTAEKMTIERFNKLAPSEKQEFWALASTSEQEKLAKFLSNDKKDKLSLTNVDGSTTTLTKVSLPLHESKQWSHVVAETAGQKTKQLYVVDKTSGSILPFSQINLGYGQPDNVVALSSTEIEKRMIETHPFLQMVGESTKAMSIKESILTLARARQVPVPNYNMYWREFYCEDPELTTASVIYHYKNAVTVSSALNLLDQCRTKLLNVVMRYLYEIDVNTLTCLGSLFTIPPGHLIDLNEEIRLAYNRRLVNPPLILANIICRIYAMRNNTLFCPNVMFYWPTTDRVATGGPNVLDPSVATIATAHTVPLSNIREIDIDKVLDGQSYSFKLYTCNTNENKPCAFVVLHVHDLSDIIATCRAQIGVVNFAQLYEPFRQSIVSLFNLYVGNIPGLKSSITLINLDHASNPLTFVNQNCIPSRPPKPLEDVKQTEGMTELEKAQAELIASYESHEPVKVVVRRTLPDNYFEPIDPNDFQNVPALKLSVDFVKLEIEE
jgi:hypothetical protein